MKIWGDGVMQTQLTFQSGDGSSILTSPLQYWVEPINAKDTYWFLLNKHYAKRIPPITKAFGLFLKSELVGVVTYGKALLPNVTKRICGEKYWTEVIELNRLSLLNNNKNEASILISKSLKMLVKPSIVLSYADTQQNHLGIVYQATNWLYTGLTAKAKDVQIEGLENIHSRTWINLGTMDELKILYKDKFKKIDRAQKHRYLYFLGTKQEIKERKDNLMLEVLLYPKRVL